MLRAALRDCVDRLDEPYAEAVRLRYLEGRGSAHIADQLEIWVAIGRNWVVLSENQPLNGVGSIAGARACVARWALLDIRSARASLLRRAVLDGDRVCVSHVGDTRRVFGLEGGLRIDLESVGLDFVSLVSFGMTHRSFDFTTSFQDYRHKT